VQAYHLLVTYLVPEARLVLVGAGRLPRYHRALHRQVEDLGLERAWLAGVVDDHELSALWRHATMFVTASEHEGFCIPLVEAMACGVPVLARSCAAIPETVGDAALLLDGDAGPEVMAEAMAELIHNTELHAELQRRGALRASRFDADRARRLFVRHLLTLV
jgi:glycosyltransferase involved in cell wall biosynthesis